MTATIHYLVICHQCHDKLEPREAATIWDNSIYCDNCYYKLLDSLDFPELEYEE